MEVWSKGGFLRSDTLIGTATMKLAPLETSCVIHDSFDLYEGRKSVGGKVDYFLNIWRFKIFHLFSGGSQDKDSSLGKILGPSFKSDEIPSVLEKLLGVFVAKRDENESFLNCYRRVGIDPFKEAVYA